MSMNNPTDLARFAEFYKQKTGIDISDYIAGFEQLRPFLRRRWKPIELTRRIEGLQGLPTGSLMIRVRGERQSTAVQGRYIFYMVMYHYSYTLKSIGQYSGNRDHSTILHGLNSLYDLYETNRTIKNRLDYIFSELGFNIISDPSDKTHRYKLYDLPIIGPEEQEQKEQEQEQEAF